MVVLGRNAVLRLGFLTGFVMMISMQWSESHLISSHHRLLLIPLKLKLKPFFKDELSLYPKSASSPAKDHIEPSQHQ